ncbi:sigma-70 family RNA polymerase sigma factor [Streptomyces nodosus]|uniref:sigma-70 family RNA polymerase sigma factor n=1 Tax=Streptomyces nodosus TaxID=40318 RepID=UPI0036E2EEA8
MSVDGQDESLGSDGAGTARRVPDQGGPSRSASESSSPGGAPGPAVPPQRDGAGRTSAAGLPPSDAELIQRMRGGDDTAYEELYRRHSGALRRYARTCCRDPHTAEDLTAEVFARMLQAVRAGSGPEHAVRAYLLTTVRRVAATWTKTAKHEHLVDDFAVFATQAARLSGAPGGAADPGSPGTGVELGADVLALHEAEQSLARQAFRSLPERWQAVLWHTEVEDESPSEVAALFGLDANGTRVLASRAREGLRQAYLQAHVSAALAGDEECARYAGQLGTYARGRLRTRAEQGLHKHLEECAGCRLAAAQIEELASGIPAVVPVAVIGWFGAAGYAKALGVIAGGAGAGAAGTAGAAATASGGASGGASSGGAASEGLGAPLKAAVAAGVVAVAAGAIALAMVGHQKAAHPPQAEVPVTQAVESQVPAPVPTPEKPPATGQPTVPPAPAAPPTPSAAPAPVALVLPTQPAASPPPAPTAQSTPTPTPTSAPAPAPTSAPPSSPAPTPTPSPTPAPTPTPTASATPTPPAPAVYRWNELPYDLAGDGTGPEMRIGESTWVWQRWGMSIADRPYAYGVTVSGSSSVTIALNRPCEAFDALVGVDDLTTGRGRVRFSVYVDGVQVWRSPVIEDGRVAVPVHVGLGGDDRTVRLVVEPRVRHHGKTFADWAEARFSCR